MISKMEMIGVECFTGKLVVPLTKVTSRLREHQPRKSLVWSLQILVKDLCKLSQAQSRSYGRIAKTL